MTKSKLSVSTLVKERKHNSPLPVTERFAGYAENRIYNKNAKMDLLIEKVSALEKNIGKLVFYMQNKL